MLSPRGPSRLHARGNGSGEPRQVDREDASRSGQIARMEPAMIRLDAPSAEREAKAEARAVRAALLEWPEQVIDVPGREPAAFVFDLDAHARGTAPDPERDRRI